MPKITVATATPELRKEWIEKGKKTRKQKELEKAKKLAGLVNMPNDDIEKYIAKFQFALRAAQVGKLDKSDAKHICEVLILLEDI